jgi:hypothetical protein
MGFDEVRKNRREPNLVLDSGDGLGLVWEQRG